MDAAQRHPTLLLIDATLERAVVGQIEARWRRVQMWLLLLLLLRSGSASQRSSLLHRGSSRLGLGELRMHDRDRDRDRVVVLSVQGQQRGQLVLLALLARVGLRADEVRVGRGRRRRRQRWGDELLCGLLDALSRCGRSRVGDGGGADDAVDDLCLRLVEVAATWPAASRVQMRRVGLGGRSHRPAPSQVDR